MIRQMYNKFRISMVLDDIERLEHQKHFLSVFFCGEVTYPIKLKRWEQDYAKAKAKLKLLKSAQTNLTVNKE